MTEQAYSSWINCCDTNSEMFLQDTERIAIDRMGDALGVLDDDTIGIRGLITRFECCYHLADQQADLIVRAIASGKCPVESGERPPERKRLLEYARNLLSAWCLGDATKADTLTPPEASARDVASALPARTELSVWQVERIVEKIASGLDAGYAYHLLAFDGPDKAAEYYGDHLHFLQTTCSTIIEDTVDGRRAEISLAMAIDLLMPCHWDFVGCLRTILQAIDGDLRPRRPFTCCARNLSLNPLCARLKVVAATLGCYWQDIECRTDIDTSMLQLLADRTPVRRWLGACFDKTLRFQLAGDFPLSLK